MRSRLSLLLAALALALCASPASAGPKKKGPSKTSPAKKGPSPSITKGCPAPKVTHTGGKKSLKTTQLGFRSAGDECGIVYWLGSNARESKFANPAEIGQLSVSASSLMNDSQPASALVGRKLVRLTTKPTKDAWFTVDFGRYRVVPSRYALRHYASWDAEAVRNWELEASNDGQSWTRLRAHDNDTSLTKKGQWASWALTASAAKKSWRFFRIRQTGLNSNKHYYLALSGFEVYGKVIDTGKVPGPSKPPSDAKGGAFTYAYDFDTNGVVHHLGTDGGKRGFQNPANNGEVAVIASSVMGNSLPPTELLARKTLRFTTKPKQGEWVLLDFLHRKVRPTHYSLRHYSAWDTEALRSWVLEASNDQKTWTVLRQHTNDTTLNHKGQSATWALSGSATSTAYRYFRIRMTGKNSNNHYYLALSGFEIYGDLVE